MPRPVSQTLKRVAEYAATAFGSQFHVREFLHDTDPIAVDILWCADRPCMGVTSYSTIGLSDHPVPWGAGEIPTRVELAGACASSVTAFPNVLASSAFMMMRSGRALHPGAVIHGYVRLYFPESTVPDLYFTTPFLWKNLRTVELTNRRVTWLLAVPIAESESRYLRAHGDHALEHRFETNNIDFYDLNRPPAV